MQSPRQRYQNDAQFHTLVDFLHNQIIQCQFTPSELREASTLASIIYEERHTEYLRPLPQVVMDWLNGTEKKGDKSSGQANSK